MLLTVCTSTFTPELYDDSSFVFIETPYHTTREVYIVQSVLIVATLAGLITQICFGVAVNFEKVHLKKLCSLIVSLVLVHQPAA